jgi:hypothetical protein
MTRPVLGLHKHPSQAIWIVWRPGTSRVRKRHRTEAEATAEALRLRKLLGGTYYVCKAVHRIGPDDEAEA